MKIHYLDLTEGLKMPEYASVQFYNDAIIHLLRKCIDIDKSNTVED